MFQAYLDQESFELSGRGPSLGHLIEAARRHCAEEGRILVEILLNGEAVAPEELSMPLPVPSDGSPDGAPQAADARTGSDSPTGASIDDDGFESAADGDVLQMTSADPYDLVVSTALRAQSAVEEVIDMQSEIAEKIQAGRTGDALPRLMEALGLWQQIRQAVEDGAALVQMDVQTFREEEADVDAAISELSEQLRAVKSALTNQDWVLLSDCLAYELNPVAEHWHGMLDTFMASVEARRAEGVS